MTYPDDSIQILTNEWWEEYTENKICRGALVWAFVPYVDEHPYTFEPIGRKEATEHETALVKVKDLRIGQTLKKCDLPVAAMPLRQSEVWGAYRSKYRPCLVIREPSMPVEKEYTRGKPNNATAPTITIAPYYGVERAKRAGFSEQFIQRVQHLVYPHFFWDKLPVKGAESSVLRIDHMMACGAHYHAYKITGYKLSEEAMELMDEIIQWNINGGLFDNSTISMFKEEINKAYYP